MPAESQIRINTLLLEREALFLRVHELEHAISTLFGEPYPFIRPSLPSDTRLKSKAKPRKSTTEAPIKLRKLAEGEVAYRVTYLDHGDEKTEEHDTPDPLQTLLATQSKTLQVKSIETIDQTGTAVEPLYALSTPQS
jgi:hypothetical protein